MAGYFYFLETFFLTYYCDCSLSGLQQNKVAKNHLPSVNPEVLFFDDPEILMDQKNFPQEEEMKKITIIACAVFTLAMFGVANAQDFVVGLDAGTAYAKDPKKFGFNSNIELGAGINPYFEIFAKPGFVWFNWDQGLAAQKQVGPGLTSQLTQTVDAYCFPVLAGAKIRFANLKESAGIIPYISVAAGYAWMNYSYKTPAYTSPPPSSTPYAAKSGSTSYSGLTYEALAGVGFPLSDTNMTINIEAGYRGMNLKDKNSNAVNMSGFVANLGASFSLGGSDM